MSTDAKSAGAFPPKTVADGLRAWADCVDIPSGQFLNEDLRHAADLIDRLAPLADRSPAPVDVGERERIAREIKAEIFRMAQFGQRTFGMWYYPETWADIAEALLATLPEPERASGQGECCVPLPGEPSFTFLGRDPQAPPKIDAWADERERAEPESDKPARARAVAKAMREWKAANPHIGMSAALLAPVPHPIPESDKAALLDAPATGGGDG
jgi:hypothetical protein